MKYATHGAFDRKAQNSIARSKASCQSGGMAAAFLELAKSPE